MNETNKTVEETRKEDASMRSVFHTRKHVSANEKREATKEAKK